MMIRNLAHFIGAVAAAAVGLTVPAAHAAMPKIDAKGWQTLFEGDDTSMYFKPATSAKGHPTLWLRYEFATPGAAEGERPSLSVTSLTQFHCRRKAYRDLEYNRFDRNNLKGAHPPGDAFAGWQPIEDRLMTDILEVVCEGAATGAPKPWPALTAGVWEPLDDDDAYKSFYSLSSPMSYPRLWIRHEYLEPGEWDNRAFLSAQELIEFDCERRFTRSVFTVLYPQNNLQGAPDMSAPKTEWAAPELGSSDSFAMFAACLSDIPAAADESQGRETSSSMAVKNKPFAFANELDWTPVMVTEDTKIFVRGASSALYPQVEIRTEFISVQTFEELRYRSGWSRIEVDCAGRRQRFLEIAAYPNTNLKGARIELVTETDWTGFEEDGLWSVAQMFCATGMESPDQAPAAP